MTPFFSSCYLLPSKVILIFVVLIQKTSISVISCSAWMKCEQKIPRIWDKHIGWWYFFSILYPISIRSPMIHKMIIKSYINVILVNNFWKIIFKNFSTIICETCFGTGRKRIRVYICEQYTVFAINSYMARDKCVLCVLVTTLLYLS